MPFNRKGTEVKTEKPITNSAKPISRSAEERSQPSTISFSKSLTAWIDRWAERNNVSSRSDAVRQLVEKGLATGAKRGLLKADSPETTKTISDIAGKQIDLMSDPSATKNEREVRKQRLLRGPKEFRSSRK
jgi:Arc/MetJ-type ribon-helix-helix transcriptional regulator